MTFVLDGFSTDQYDLLYVEDPKFEEIQKPTVTRPPFILEIKVRAMLCRKAVWYLISDKHTYTERFTLLIKLEGNNTETKQEV